MKKRLLLDISYDYPDIQSENAETLKSMMDSVLKNKSLGPMTQLDIILTVLRGLEGIGSKISLVVDR